jgi:hypothetical protein
MAFARKRAFGRMIKDPGRFFGLLAIIVVISLAGFSQASGKTTLRLSNGLAPGTSQNNTQAGPDKSGHLPLWTESSVHSIIAFIFSTYPSVSSCRQPRTFGAMLFILCHRFSLRPCSLHTFCAFTILRKPAL